MSVLPPEDAAPFFERGFSYPPEPEYPFGGAIHLESITPASGSVENSGGYAITARIVCPGGLLPALVTIAVNGVTCTVANDRLEYWQTQSISGGVIVGDLSDVYFGTVARFVDHSFEEITATVTYDGQTIGSTTFTTREHEGDGNKGAYWTAWAINIKDTAGAPNIEYIIRENYIAPSRDIQYLIQDAMAHVGADVRYHIGERYRVTQTASGIVAYVVRNRQPASGCVRGWRLDRQRASGVVQGYKVDRQTASGIVGVRFVYRDTASGVVGIAYLKKLQASGVAYAVNRHNVLDVHVADAATYQSLIDDGFVFS